MSGYIGTQPVPQATQTRDVFTATSGQTSFATSGYTPNFLDVWLNGVKLVNGDDFTATNGSDVVLTTGAAAGDTVEVLSYSTYEVNAQTYTGGLTVNNDAATVLTVDRATSDGTLVDFKKDGTSVGSVGTQGGDKLTVGNAAVGVAFNNTLGVESIYPWNLTTNDARDAAVDIGYPTVRFKDLYLSGGVYLGGTGAANLLDDYEEGSWTPTIISFSGPSATMSLQYGTYTKVGKLVTISARLSTTDVPSSGPVLVGGLPFNPTASVNDYPIGAVYTQSVSYGTGTHVLMMVPNGAPFLQPMIGGADYNAHPIGPADVGAFGFYMAFSVTYRTD